MTNFGRPTTNYGRPAHSSAQAPGSPWAGLTGRRHLRGDGSLPLCTHAIPRATGHRARTAQRPPPPARPPPPPAAPKPIKGLEQHHHQSAMALCLTRYAYTKLSRIVIMLIRLSSTGSPHSPCLLRPLVRPLPPPALLAPAALPALPLEPRRRPRACDTPKRSSASVQVRRWIWSTRLDSVDACSISNSLAVLRRGVCATAAGHIFASAEFRSLGLTPCKRALDARDLP